MLDREVFEEMIKMLGDVHGWKPISDVAKDAMCKQLAKYGADTNSFGEHCLKVMGVQFLKPAHIVEHFQALYVQESRQKALPQAEVNADIQSDEFICFVRMNRELRAALAQGEAYPMDKVAFRELWQRPLTEADREYAAQRRESRRLQVMGLEIPVGGAYA